MSTNIPYWATVIARTAETNGQPGLQDAELEAVIAELNSGDNEVERSVVTKQELYDYIHNHWDAAEEAKNICQAEDSSRLVEVYEQEAKGFEEARGTLYFDYDLDNQYNFRMKSISVEALKALLKQAADQI